MLKIYISSTHLPIVDPYNPDPIGVVGFCAITSRDDEVISIIKEGCKDVYLTSLVKSHLSSVLPVKGDKVDVQIIVTNYLNDVAINETYGYGLDEIHTTNFITNVDKLNSLELVKVDETASVPLLKAANDFAFESFIQLNNINGGE